MILYYRTREARRTLRHGFKNAAWEVGDRTLRGILVSERPLKTNDEIKNDEFLEITLDPVQCQLDRFELHETGSSTREWCVPASILNTYSRVRLLPWHEATDRWEIES
jgi:hypothetical protein